MRKLAFCFLAGLAGFFSGCVVLSVCPFYTEKDATFDSALLGAWTNTTSADQRWTFEKEGAGGYHLTCVDGNERSVMRAQLFKLQGVSFLDLSRTNSSEEPFPPPIPSHVLLRVLQIAPVLRLAPLKYDWLKAVLEKEPKTLRHHWIAGEGKPEDRYFVLTASTEELQQLVIKHLNDGEPWKDVIELKRASAAGRP